MYIEVFKQLNEETVDIDSEPFLSNKAYFSEYIDDINTIYLEYNINKLKLTYRDFLGSHKILVSNLRL